jgi:FKBP-type peptidyl-prolyl cis-trans isomerase FkpA
MRGLLLCLIPVSLLAQAAQPPVAPSTDEEKTVYSLGLSIYRSLAQFDLSPAELDLVKRAISDAAADTPAVDLDTWGPKIQALATGRQARVTEREKASAKAYIDKVAAEPGAVKTDSGLIYKELTPGTGDSPAAADKVKVNYRGTFTNGKEFDSSYSRNEPAEFPLNGVIKCWTEGVQKMKVGGKSRLVCPSDLAYGDGGRPGIPGGSTLVFEVELLSIGGGAK